MIALTSPVYAPGTTVAAVFVSVDVMFNDRGAGNVRVRFFDAKKVPIHPAQAVRPMTRAEHKAFLAVTATAGETLSELALRAAAPYLLQAYDVTLP